MIACRSRSAAARPSAFVNQKGRRCSHANFAPEFYGSAAQSAMDRGNRSNWRWASLPLLAAARIIQVGTCSAAGAGADPLVVSSPNVSPSSLNSPSEVKERDLMRSELNEDFDKTTLAGFGSNQLESASKGFADLFLNTAGSSSLTCIPRAACCCGNPATRSVLPCVVGKNRLSFSPTTQIRRRTSKPHGRAACLLQI